MLSRLSGFVIVALWIAAMTWLVIHDVVPGWTARQRPHTLDVGRLDGEGACRCQMGIFDNDGRRIGALWTVYTISPESIRREDIVLMESLGSSLPSLRIDGTSLYTGDGHLDELTIRLYAGDSREALRLHGERFPAHFAFRLEMGAARLQTFKIPAAQADTLSDAFNPFAAMPDLQVGQTWRLQVFNPVSALLGACDRFTPMLVKVTGRERILTVNGEKECHIVETHHARAWVDADGVVWLQEVRLPLGPPLRIVREVFEDAHYTRATTTYPR